MSKRFLVDPQVTPEIIACLHLSNLIGSSSSHKALWGLIRHYYPETCYGDWTCTVLNVNDVQLYCHNSPVMPLKKEPEAPKEDEPIKNAPETFVEKIGGWVYGKLFKSSC